MLNRKAKNPESSSSGGPYTLVSHFLKTAFLFPRNGYLCAPKAALMAYSGNSHFNGSITGAAEDNGV